MNKKGFTLIELLATIVILGLLALIVTPGVAKVIRNSKFNTSKASLEGYIREIENASALYMSDTGVYPESIEDLELDGKNLDKVSNVNVELENGSVKKLMARVNDVYCRFEKGEGTECQENMFIGTYLYYDPVNNTKCDTYTKANSASGVKEGCLRWNVLSVEEDGTLNLLLDHNIVSGKSWASKADYVTAGGDGDAYDASTYVYEGNTYVGGLNDKGPVTIVSQLNTATSAWHSSLTRTDSYQDYNGDTLKYTVNYNGMKARLPEAVEIAAAVGHPTYNQNTSASWFYLDSLNQTRIVGQGTNKKVSNYAWLFNNLGNGSQDVTNTDSCLYYGCSETQAKSSGDYGYWTSTSLAGHSSLAWRVFYSGSLVHGHVTNAGYGIRPVITLNAN